MKAVLSLVVHFNTDKINAYANYADIRQINIHTIAQLVRFQPLTTQTLVQSQVRTCGICGGKVTLGQVVSMPQRAEV